MIWLLRHGEDDEKYIGGWSDVPLTERGIRQATEAADYLVEQKIPIKKIIASDIKRARMTADICGEKLHLVPTYTAKLRELNKGKINGLLIEEAKQKYPDYFQELPITTRFPEGESLLDLYKRMKHLFETETFDENTLLVTHRGVINMLYFLFQDRLPDYDKKQFGCEHGSLYECDMAKRYIKKVR